MTAKYITAVVSMLAAAVAPIVIWCTSHDEGKITDFIIRNKDMVIVGLIAAGCYLVCASIVLLHSLRKE